MTPKNDRVSIEELRKRLEYDPETGVLRWRKRHVVAGYIKPSGYRTLEWWSNGGRERRHGGETVYLLAHRVVWALATGAWPKDQIDHRDGNRDNNRLANLREATMAENHQNRPPWKGRKYLVGASPVPRCHNRWRAGMSGHNYLGTYGSEREAHEAYLAAKAKYHTFQPRPRGI